jgi:very-short-patch-repair endonuclease
VIALAQLRALGFSESRVHKWVASGRLHRVHQGVYSTAPPELLTRNGRYMAAVLACGSGAALSHRSAAGLLGLRATDRSQIDVIRPSSTARRHAGINLHRSRTLTPADITSIDGIPCTNVARTLLDLAAVVANRPLERALEQAEVEHVLDGRALEDQLRRNPRTRGAKRLRAALADHDETAKPTESELEEWLYRTLRRGRLPLPERQVYIDPGDGEPPVRVDFAWRAQKLVVETDGGRYHRTRRAFESDRRRDQRLTQAGWRVIRVTWRQLRDEPERILRMFESLLGRV